MQPKLICCEERLQGADLPPPLLCEASEQNDSEKGMREKEGRGGENSYTILSLHLQPNSSCVTIRSTSSSSLGFSVRLSLPCLVLLFLPDPIPFCFSTFLALFSVHQSCLSILFLSPTSLSLSFSYCAQLACV